MIRSSSAVHRDNPVFEFAVESPEIGERGDGVFKGFDGIVRLGHIECLPAPQVAAEYAIAVGV